MSEQTSAERTEAAAPNAQDDRETNARSPWAALFAVIIGFFMILVDTTIVSVANPAIKAALDPGSPNLDNVVWVVSAYLLAFAVPLLITGSLGDRFGPRRIYLIGLAVFTLASLACGLSTTLVMLVASRAVQGLGAALMTPQTMAVITRTFPPARRGVAMGIWGSTSGVAMLVGPLAGGFLVGSLGWEWIFFVNLPVGLIGFVLALLFVPKLETHHHRLDGLGMVLSAVAMFLVVFALQEGESSHWDARIWVMLAAGIAMAGIFVAQQARTTREPLLPLALFRDRNFAMANITMVLIAFTVTSVPVPLMFFLQLARGLSPIRAALLTIPLAAFTLVLSPLAGRLQDRIDARWVLIPALVLYSAGIFWYAQMASVTTPILMLLLPSVLIGIGNAGLWGPLASTATLDLPPHQAGAGSGIYNAAQRIGSVLGSAAIAGYMQSRLAAHLPTGSSGATRIDVTGALPARIAEPFSAAMGQTFLLPAIAVLLGVVPALFLRPRPAGRSVTESRAGSDG